MSGTAQFEGRTAEEAVARARAVLGDAGALRCWKTRRGGVGGFFAREVFVASLTPPPGSEATRGRTSQAEPAKPGRVRRRRPVVDGTKAISAPGPIDRAREEQSVGPEDHLFGLVEATADQVSLRSLSIPDGAFDEVLAEAQAALARDNTEARDISAPVLPERPAAQPLATDRADVDQPVEDQPVEDQQVEDQAEVLPNDPAEAASGSEPPASRDLAPSGAAVAATARQPRKTPRAKPESGRTARARRATAAKPAQRNRQARVPDLRAGLRGLGVPDSFVPRGRRPSLDELAGALETLPAPPPMPVRAGAVVAILGAGQDLDRTIDLVVRELSLGQRDVVRSEDPASMDAPRLGRQVARRRGGGRTCVVAVHAAPGTPLRPEIREFLGRATPDYVLAAVGARCKRVDVEHWITGLSPVDSLALWDLSGTRTPAELLGLYPIAFVDGRATSALAWTLVLAARALEDGQ